MTKQTDKKIIEKLKALAESKDVISLVNSWLNANTAHSLSEEKCKKIYSDVLGEISLYNDRFDGEPHFAQRIMDRDRVYLSKDEDSRTKVYVEVTRRMVAEGMLEPTAEISSDPSYSWWQLRHQAEAELIRIFSEPLKVNPESLYGNMENYKKFIELTIKMVVNSGKFVAENYADVK